MVFKNTKDKKYIIVCDCKDMGHQLHLEFFEDNMAMLTVNKSENISFFRRFLNCFKKEKEFYEFYLDEKNQKDLANLLLGKTK